MVRAESELVEINLHVLLAHMDVGRSDGPLEQPPEALNRVDGDHNYGHGLLIADSASTFTSSH